MQKIGKYVSGKALAAVKTAAAGAERGDLSAMKYLFEMIGLYPAAPETEGSPGDEQSLAKTLRDGCN